MRIKRRQAKDIDPYTEFVATRGKLRTARQIKADTKVWTKSKADEAAVKAGCWFDLNAANHAVNFCEKFLIHSKGKWAGQPFNLLKWQKSSVIMPLFGWKNADKSRRFRMAYIEIPKKNGKSTLASAIALYLLSADGEPGAEVYCAAADRQQASIVYREARNMTKRSPALRSLLAVRDSRKEILLDDNDSILRVLSAEAYTSEGLNIHSLIFDELHAQKTRDLWDALRYGGAAREQPMLVSITTAGWDVNSICYEQHTYAARILDDEDPHFDDSFFAYISAADNGADWKSLKTAKSANPSYNITIQERDFREAIKEAVESPRKENSYKRYRLNLWTEQAERWLSMDKWDACDSPVDAEALEGAACWVGLDLSSTTDISAAVLVFPEEPGCIAIPMFWIPEEGARERERRDRVPYTQWARDGLIEMTPGNVIDYDIIRTRLNELNEKYPIQEIAIDRWNATHLSTQLMSDGLEVVAFGQGYASMSAPTKELEAHVISRKLAHGGNPVLRWVASNIAAEEDAAGNIKPSKKRSPERIDGIVALIMGIGLSMAREDAYDGKLLIV